MASASVAHGLEGVVAAETRLSMVDGARGELVIAGFPVAELAQNATFEETAFLLWEGDLPDAAQAAGFRADLAARRALSEEALRLLEACARQGTDAMDALRIAIGAVSISGGEAADILAQAPTIVAAYARMRKGEAPVAPRAELGFAASFLYMLQGEEPSAERVRGLETYLNTVVDH